MSLKNVIEGGYCIGCGGCTVNRPKGIEIIATDEGTFSARIDASLDLDTLNASSKLCPFSDASLDEKQLGEVEFRDTCKPYDPKLGYLKSVYAARVTQSELYSQATSGGVVRWILIRLLELGYVDKIILVDSNTECDSPQSLFGYRIYSSVEEVANVSRSAYHPISAANALQYVMENEGRYAFVGLPCFIKSVRLIAHSDEAFRRRMTFCVSIICGHLKSSRYTELLSNQLGVAASEITRIDFRDRDAHGPANRPNIKVKTRQGTYLKARSSDLFGTNYGHGFLKYKACDYCDDVVGELGDISVGDAWLPQYLDKGTSIIAIRSALAETVFKAGIAENALWTEQLTNDDLAKSQEASFRHRRDGLSYRLFLRDREGIWRPKKRVEAGKDHLSERQRKLFELRETIRVKSFEYWEKTPTNIERYIERMRPYVLRMDLLYADSARSAFRRMAKIVLEKIGILRIMRKLRNV